MSLKLVVLQGSQPGREIAVQKLPFVVGRAPECNLRPNNDSVSRLHCAFQRNDDALVLQDLGSKHGTYVNGAKLSNNSKTLKGGDVVQVGHLVFQVHMPQPVAKRRKPRLKLEDAAVIWLMEAPSEVEEVEAPAVAANDTIVDGAPAAKASAETLADVDAKALGSAKVVKRAAMPQRGPGAHHPRRAGIFNSNESLSQTEQYVDAEVPSTHETTPEMPVVRRRDLEIPQETTEHHAETPIEKPTVRRIAGWDRETLQDFMTTTREAAESMAVAKPTTQQYRRRKKEWSLPRYELGPIGPLVANGLTVLLVMAGIGWMLYASGAMESITSMCKHSVYMAMQPHNAKPRPAPVFSSVAAD